LSLERIEKLEARWRELGVFQDVESAFDRIGFTDAYLNQLGCPPNRAKLKVIKDGVWGMIEVDPSTMRLLASVYAPQPPSLGEIVFVGCE